MTENELDEKRDIQVAQVKPEDSKREEGKIVMNDTPDNNAQNEEDENEVTILDIEHLPVTDDPRKWSKRKKSWVLGLIALMAMCGPLGANIYFPAVSSVQLSLHASSSQISLSVSLFIMCQGLFPILWSAFSELWGRKQIYMASMGLFLIANLVAALSKNVETFLGMRVLQGVAGSAVFAIGAGTLADIYDTEERGKNVGVFYAAPLLGPSLGPLIGGALSNASSWRATFYFMVGYAGICCVLLIFFPETYRKERSLAWRKAMTRALEQAQKKRDAQEAKQKERKSFETNATDLEKGNETIDHDEDEKEEEEEEEEELDQKPRNEKDEETTKVQKPSPRRGSTTTTGSSPPQTRPSIYPLPSSGELLERSTSSLEIQENNQNPNDIEVNPNGGVATTRLNRMTTSTSAAAAAKQMQMGMVRIPSIKPGGKEETVKIKVTVWDVSPLGSAGEVLKVPSNAVTLAFTGILYGAQYSLAFTAATSFAGPPWRYNALQVGLVLLAFGLGNMCGSIGGGRYSDMVLASLKQKNNGVGKPEMRIKSTAIPLCFISPSYIAYAWMVDKGVDVWWDCIVLFVGGASIIWVYSAVLTFVVDNNRGRSSSAVAVNSLFRGVSGFVASEVATPLEDSIGNGWLYTIWAAILTVSMVGLVWVGWRPEIDALWRRWRYGEKEDEKPHSSSETKV